MAEVMHGANGDYLPKQLTLEQKEYLKNSTSVLIGLGVLGLMQRHLLSTEQDAKGYLDLANKTSDESARRIGASFDKAAQIEKSWINDEMPITIWFDQSPFGSSQSSGYYSLVKVDGQGKISGGVVIGLFETAEFGDIYTEHNSLWSRSIDSPSEQDPPREIVESILNLVDQQMQIGWHPDDSLLREQ